VLTRTIEERFLAIVCQDTELLDAEFDAIIAAGWEQPPAPPPRRPRPPSWPPTNRPTPREAARTRHGDHPVTDNPTRQRSPPHDRKTGDE
jgi:hypothetical protein